MSNLFSQLADLTAYERTLQIGRPEDIEIVDPAKNQGKRFKLRSSDAPTTEIHIHALNDKQREEAQKMVSRYVPPRIYIEKFSPEGKLVERMPSGWDDEDPKYLADREAASVEQRAFIALWGCPKLAEDTPGDDTQTKADNLRAKLDSKLIDFIAQGVWHLGYAAGDATDFFCGTAS